MSNQVGSATLASNTAAPGWRLPVYERGQQVTSVVTFANASGVATDPSTIVATVRYPGGVTSYTYPASVITKVGTGVYSLAVDTTLAYGLWAVRWVGTGTVAAAVDEIFGVTSP